MRQLFQLKITLGLFAVAVMLNAIGCSTLTTGSKPSAQNKKDSSWNWFKKAEYQTPRSMASYWKEDTLTMPGMPTARGFGGRIYFYDEKSKVISVDGELVVHAYDESLHANPSTSSDAADKVFHFREEEFASHFSPGEFGASYSVWLPWDGVGGFQKKITLIPTFKSKDGTSIIQGQPSKITLPGKSPSGLQEHAESATVKLDSNSNPTNSTDLVSLASNPWAGINTNSGLQTTTINVPLSAGSPMMNRNARNENLNVVNDQVDMKQQMATLQKQYVESNLRSMQVTNALLGQNNANPQQNAMTPVQASQAQAGQAQAAANVQRLNGPQMLTPNVPSNAFNKDYALGPFGPITNSTDSTTQSIHSVWSQSQAPALQSVQPATYRPL